MRSLPQHHHKPREEERKTPYPSSIGVTHPTPPPQWTVHDDHESDFQGEEEAVAGQEALGTSPKRKILRKRKKLILVVILALTVIGVGIGLGVILQRRSKPSDPVGISESPVGTCALSGLPASR